MDWLQHPGRRPIRRVFALQPGVLYRVRELVDDPEHLVCVSSFDPDPADPAYIDGNSIYLVPGELVTCTFGFSQTGTLVLAGRTLQDPGDQPFGYVGDVVGTIGHGETVIEAEALPGTYVSTQAQPLPDGWELTNIECVETDSPPDATRTSKGDLATATATFGLDAGETVTCTFTNTYWGQTITFVQPEDSVCWPPARSTSRTGPASTRVSPSSTRRPSTLPASAM